MFFFVESSYEPPYPIAIFHVVVSLFPTIEEVGLRSNKGTFADISGDFDRFGKKVMLCVW